MVPLVIRSCSVLFTMLVFLASSGTSLNAQEKGPDMHWKLQGNLRDSSGNKNTASNHGADLSAVGIKGEKNGSAQFDGRKSYIEIPHSQSLALGSGDFSVSLWVHTTEKMDDNPGDLITKYDPETRRGFNLSLVNHAGVVGSQANYRNIQFGIDNGKQSDQWRDA